mgnify:CR=1 FL=1
MERSQEGRIEELSKKVGGRFKLTALIQKQARGYYLGGRAFMPTVRNLDELFSHILDEIEEEEISLLIPVQVEEQEEDEDEDEEEGSAAEPEAAQE